MWRRRTRFTHIGCAQLTIHGMPNLSVSIPKRLEKNVSPNLVTALQLAKQVGARVIGIVGKDGGYTAKVADACVIVPTNVSGTSTTTLYRNSPGGNCRGSASTWAV